MLGLLWFFVGLALMAGYLLLNVPFWIGLPVAVLGLLYQFIGLWFQRKTKPK